MDCFWARLLGDFVHSTPNFLRIGKITYLYLIRNIQIDTFIHKYIHTIYNCIPTYINIHTYIRKYIHTMYKHFYIDSYMLHSYINTYIYLGEK